MNPSNFDNIELISLIDLKRQAFGLRVAKVYNKEEYSKNIKTLRRKIARIATGLNN
jgi:ribosomal protein L29